MANNCLNNITGTGSLKQVQKAVTLLKNKTMEQLWELVQEDTKNRESTELYQIDCLTRKIILSIDSRWTPCEHFCSKLSAALPNLDWTLDYSETGNYFAGRSHYKDGDEIFKRTGLPHEHISTFQSQNEFFEEYCQPFLRPRGRKETLPVFNIHGWDRPLQIAATNAATAAAQFLDKHTELESDSLQEMLGKAAKNEEFYINRLDVPIKHRGTWLISVKASGTTKLATSNPRALAITNWWTAKNL